MGEGKQAGALSCNTPCQGGEHCGGFFSMSVYQAMPNSTDCPTPSFHIPPAVGRGLGADVGDSLGCYQDQTMKRLLPYWALGKVHTVTPQLCAVECYSRGFDTAGPSRIPPSCIHSTPLLHSSTGVEATWFCFCGFTHHLNANMSVNLEECNWNCTGLDNSGEFPPLPVFFMSPQCIVLDSGSKGHAEALRS